MSLAKILLTLCLAITLAGCTTPLSTPPMFPSDPMDLQVPKWTVGDQWNYKDAEGTWENWTVVAKEERGGHSTYRVKMELSKPDVGGSRGHQGWMSVKTLGVVEGHTDDGFWVKYDPPESPIFPIENASLSGEYTTNYGSKKSELQKTVSSWQQHTVTAGTFQTVQVDFYDTWLDQMQSQGWYSPLVKNYVQYDYYEPKSLVSWTVAS